MGKPTFQSGPIFGVQPVQTSNDKFPILKTRHQPPPHKCGHVGIESRQTVEEIGNIDTLGSGIRVRRGPRPLGKRPIRDRWSGGDAYKPRRPVFIGVPDVSPVDENCRKFPRTGLGPRLPPPFEDALLYWSG